MRASAIAVGWCCASVACGVSVAIAAPAASAQRSVRLAYGRLAGAERCPDEALLRLAVASRLGYDPFHAQAPAHLEVSLARVGRDLRARIALDERTRVLTSRNPDCVDLASALALAISIAIDPLVLDHAPPAAATAATGNPSPSSAATAAAAPADSNAAAATRSITPTATPPSTASDLAASPVAARPPIVELDDRPPRPAVTVEPTRLRATIGLHVAAGTAPTAAFGLALGLGARRPGWSISVEARGDLPASQPAAGGQVSTWQVTGALVPCLHVGAFSGCLVAAAGALFSDVTGFSAPRPQTDLVARLGLRAAIELPLSRTLALLIGGELSYALVMPAITVEVVQPDGPHPPVELYRVPALSGAMGVALVLSWPPRSAPSVPPQ